VADRITDKDLDTRIAYLNKLMGMADRPYIDGKPQAGNFHLSYAYGGVCVHRMSEREGCTGVSTPILQAHETKRKTLDALNAYISAQYERLESVKPYRVVHDNIGTILAGLHELQGNHDEGDEHWMAIDALCTRLASL
jgi:hypothetical protein